MSEFASECSGARSDGSDRTRQVVDRFDLDRNSTLEMDAPGILQAGDPISSGTTPARKRTRVLVPSSASMSSVSNVPFAVSH